MDLILMLFRQNSKFKSVRTSPPRNKRGGPRPMRPPVPPPMPAVPNSDTLFDESVIVYPIHTDQCTPSFLGEDHTSYCTTV